MKLTTVLRAVLVVASTLFSLGASAIPITSGVTVGADFNLGLSGPVTELGLGVVFANTGMAANDTILISVFASEGGALLGTLDLTNTFGMTVLDLGETINLPPGLVNGTGFATYQSVTGSFDLT